jgi:hypothetical protein
MSDEAVPEDPIAPVPPPGTLAALLIAPLADSLSEAVSTLVGTSYAAHIRRVEPRAHGGAEIIVEFIPRTPEATLKIEVGAEMVEIPLPPGVVADDTSERRNQEP